MFKGREEPQSASIFLYNGQSFIYSATFKLVMKLITYKLKIAN